MTYTPVPLGAIYMELEFRRSVALAANARTSGLMDSTGSYISKTVPTGKAFKVLYATFGGRTGASTGSDYSVDMEIKINSGYTSLGTAVQASASANITGSVVGTVDAPLAKAEAGEVLRASFKNLASSPGALASSSHMVSIVGVLVDA